MFVKYAGSYPCKCGTILHVSGEKKPIAELALTSTAEWTRWAKIVSRFRQEGDKGVGDTFERLARHFGGERIKAWSKRLGIPCGCCGRQAAWNRLYPYK